jgi:hypothetical protein
VKNDNFRFRLSLSALSKIGLTGLIFQGLNVAIALFRIPLILKEFGTGEFVRFSIAIALWPVVAAIGEGLRSFSRQHEKYSRINRKHILITQTFLWTILLLLILLEIFSLFPNSEFQSQLSYIILVVAIGIAYIPAGSVIGKIEADHGSAEVYKIGIFSQVFCLLVTILGVAIQSEFLTLISFVISPVLTGIILFLRFEKLYFAKRLNSPNSIEFKGNFSYVSLQLLETFSTFSDLTIVALILNEVDAATFVIFQRFAMIFSLLPSIWSPYTSTLNKSETLTEFRKLRRYVFLSVSIIVIPCLFFARGFFNTLSEDIPSPPYTLFVFFFSLQWLASSLSPYISYSSFGLLFKIRLKLMIIVVVVGVPLKILLAIDYGYIGIFYVTTIWTIFTAFILRHNMIR